MYFNNVNMKAELWKIIKKIQTKNKGKTNSLYFGNMKWKKMTINPEKKYITNKNK